MCGRVIFSLVLPISDRSAMGLCDVHLCRFLLGLGIKFILQLLQICIIRF